MSLYQVVPPRYWPSWQERPWEARKSLWLIWSCFRTNRKGGTASLRSRTWVKRNAVFGARFKGLSLHFLYQKGSLVQWYVSKRAGYISDTYPNPYPPVTVPPLWLFELLVSWSIFISTAGVNGARSSLRRWKGGFVKGSAVKQRGRENKGPPDIAPKSFSLEEPKWCSVPSIGVIGKSALEIGQFLRRIVWMISGGPLSLPAPLCYCWKGGFGECALVPIFVPGEHPNVPSFRLSFRGRNAKTTLLESHPFVNPRKLTPKIFSFCSLGGLGTQSIFKARILNNLARLLSTVRKLEAL